MLEHVMGATLKDVTLFMYEFDSILQLTGTLASRSESATGPAGQLLCRCGAALLQSRSGTAGAPVAHRFSPRQHSLSGDPGERDSPAEGAGAPPQGGCEFSVHVQIPS